jgi:hypothetical protein
MRIFITGGSGLIGSNLIERLLKQGHKITLLTRNVKRTTQKLGNEIDYCSSLELLDTLDGYNAVINLAGEPIIGRRWSNKQKMELCNSRWNITARLTELIKNSSNPPQVFISGSAVGYYGVQSGQVLTEDMLAEDGFLHQLCKKWEELALDAQSERTRVCISRTGIVLSPKGGMLPMMLLPFRMGLGAVFGSGQQYISWIHIEDMLEGLCLLLDSTEAQGIFNFTSPNPESNRVFSDSLSAALSRPRIFRIPSFLLKMILGEAATMVLDGQYVFPQHLQEMGFHFAFEKLESAFQNILINKK